MSNYLCRNTDYVGSINQWITSLHFDLSITPLFLCCNSHKSFYMFTNRLLEVSWDRNDELVILE